MKVVIFGQALMRRSVTWPESYLAFVQNADAVICNFEGSIAPEPAWPMKTKTIVPTPKSALDDLKNLGVTHLALANNHLWDFGHSGILETVAALKRTGFATAGAGENLSKASAPARKNGVSLISVDLGPTPTWAVAGNHPGVYSVNVRFNLQLSEDHFNTVNDINLKSGQLTRQALRQKVGYDAPTQNPVFYGIEYQKGEETGEVWSIDQADLDNLLMSVDAEKRRADCCVVALHYHHWSTKWDQAPEWLQKMADRLCAAGADAVVGTGPPLPYPVHLNGNKAIAPGMGNMVFHTNRAAKYNQNNLPVWAGQVLIFENNRWRFEHIDVRSV